MFEREREREKGWTARRPHTLFFFIYGTLLLYCVCVCVRNEYSPITKREERNSRIQSQYLTAAGYLVNWFFIFSQKRKKSIFFWPTFLYKFHFVIVYVAVHIQLKVCFIFINSKLFSIIIMNMIIWLWHQPKLQNLPAFFSSIFSRPFNSFSG